MRRLYILSGVQGSGKSTFIRENKLESYTISSDKIRQQMESTVYDLNGNPYITQSNNRKVWKLLIDLVESRMQKSCLTVIDATHCSAKDLRQYRKLVKEYNYILKVIDFEVPLDELLKRNKKRDLINQLPESVIEKYFVKKSDSDFSFYNVIKKEGFKNDTLYKAQDFSKYKEIVCFGDLQGCNESLQEYFNKNKFNDNILYIFVGDYVDRGIENSDVISFLLTLVNKDNVIFMKGNHEYHLDRWSRGLEAKSRVFNMSTRYELEEAGISKKEVQYFCSKLLDYLKFTYHGKEFYVTHAGLPFIPKDEDVSFIPSHQFIRGIGSYVDDIDSLFNSQAKDNQFQIHGHRNKLKHDIQLGNSFNLEGSIEYGEDLRILTIKKDEFIKTKIKQNNINKNLLIKKDQSFLSRLRSHELIREKELGNGISSFNFTRKAFYKKQWDNTNIQARGLFIETASEKIVARSYNKFFNLNERRETKWEYLKDHLKFPLTAYQKDNGYLGILGYKDGELFYASKSSNQTDFANWFKDIVEKTLNTDKIKEVLKNGFSMVFEVNDPVNDPHIIEYDKAHVVLLDVIYNREEFKKIKYDHLCGIAKKIGSKVKIKTQEMNNWGEFELWYNLVNTDDNLLEGYVIEANDGFMFKIKLPYYSFWKYMRTVKDRVKNKKEVKRQSLSTVGNEFIDWLEKQDVELLDKDIISLRELFLSKKKI